MWGAKCVEFDRCWNQVVLSLWSSGREVAPFHSVRIVSQTSRCTAIGSYRLTRPKGRSREQWVCCSKLLLIFQTNIYFMFFFIFLKNVLITSLVVTYINKKIYLVIGLFGQKVCCLVYILLALIFIHERVYKTPRYSPLKLLTPN